MQTSMLLTIGTALTRAHSEGSPVDLLVQGCWVSGRVVAADSQGVVLEDEGTHTVVRLDRIAVVRVRGAQAPRSGSVDARPMPGPLQDVEDVA